jgi:hypothetical protein
MKKDYLVLFIILFGGFLSESLMDEDVSVPAEVVVAAYLTTV